MIKLPDKFEHIRFELLTPVVSENTLKNRRNLVVSSFIIIGIYCLDKSLLDLNVFGLKLEGAAPLKVLLFALFMISFWGFLFYLNHSKDVAFNKEKKYLLSKDEDKALDSINKRLEHLDEKLDGELVFITKERQELISEKNKHIKQNDRILKAGNLSRTTFLIDNLLPVLLGFIASIFLLKDIWSIMCA